MSDIKPALTPEEWAKTPKVLAKVEIDPPLQFIGTGKVEDYPARTIHAMAALLLRGQPFGFTREDVRLLREAIQTCESEWRMGDVEGDVAILRSLAGRLEALLPPE